jgi:hypothetical protein
VVGWKNVETFLKNGPLYYPGYYAADVFDPDRYSFEVVHKSK